MMRPLLRWVKRILGQESSSHEPPPPPVQPFRPRTAQAPTTAGAPTTAIALAETDLCIAAIGDLHGRSDLLAQMMVQLDRLAAIETIRLVEVYLGDYVDRGADSRGVLDALIARQRLTDRKVVCLAGNHEAMLISATRSDDDFVRWMEYGGQSTLRSYGVQQPRTAREVTAARSALNAAIPREHLDFLNGLDLFYQHDGFFFAHAGVRPGVPLAQQSERDLLWIRDAFLNSTASFGAVVVHGHTPQARPVLRHNRISIDTGAYQTGMLICAVISSHGVRFLDARGGTISGTA
jgi:serine/threonine protein phosphatase 1